MSHFAKVVDGVVTKVIVADPEYFDTFIDDSPGSWVQTYKDKSARTRFAGMGYTYDAIRDAFINPQPFASWSLNDSSTWEAPTPKPDNGLHYGWKEETQEWIRPEEVSSI